MIGEEGTRGLCEGLKTNTRIVKLTISSKSQAYETYKETFLSVFPFGTCRQTTELGKKGEWQSEKC